ncbi:MAG: TonB-dependent receptor, partial [Gammaproteobacteria bacterium]
MHLRMGRLSPLSLKHSALAGTLACVLLVFPFAAPCQPADDPEPVVEVLIVTARKVPEDIARVPMSVQAVPGDFIDSRGISNLYDLQFNVPGLVVNDRGMFGASLALRGVTDEGGGSLSIASHFNGVYLGRSNLALTRMFDIERVEVVKGPQGTLYGRNATGGSINVITRAPGREFEAAVEGGFGSFNTARFEGHVNLPGEAVAARLAIVGSDGDGFIRNSVDDRRFAEQDYFGFRTALRLQPTASLSVDVTAQLAEDDGAVGEVWLPRRDYLPDPNDIRLTRVTLANPYQQTKDKLATVDLSYGIGRLTLRSVTGYARNVTLDVDDCAGSPAMAACVRGVDPLRYEERSQEIRVESDPDASTQWVVGTVHYNSDQVQHFHLTLPNIAPVPLENSLSTVKTAAAAVFGDMTHGLAGRWSLTAGLRFSREQQRVAKIGSGIADTKTLTRVANSWESISWRLGFGYEPSAQTSVFGIISTGFKSGGLTTTMLPSGEFESYDPESLLAYEVGVKSSLARRGSTLGASVFYYDFDDMQVQSLLDDLVTVAVDNAAAARIFGLDLNATMRASRRVQLSGALVWMPERRFVEFIDSSDSETLSGNLISRAPEWSLSASLGYRAPMRDGGSLSVDVDYNFRTAFFFTKDNYPVWSQGDFGILNAVLRFESAGSRWYMFARA